MLIVCWFAKWVRSQIVMLLGGGQGVEKFESPCFSAQFQKKWSKQTCKSSFNV